MAERSFKKEVEKLRLGAGDEFAGEGILAITKALLQSGVAYVGGYQGAPISHLMDVLSDAQEILQELGVHFESSASEATAAAMAAVSVNYPLRGAVTFKSTVGTNVASDALANLASGGVKGGVVFIVGEDYGEGSSIMQERTHAFAMKSQIWMIDPRPNVPSIVAAVEHAFELSEASNTPADFRRIRGLSRITGGSRSVHCVDDHGHLHILRPPALEGDLIRVDVDHLAEAVRRLLHLNGSSVTSRAAGFRPREAPLIHRWAIRDDGGIDRRTSAQQPMRISPATVVGEDVQAEVQGVHVDLIRRIVEQARVARAFNVPSTARRHGSSNVDA